MAVDNFSAFKRLMIKRNSELNVQAQAMLSQYNPEIAVKDLNPSKIGAAEGLTEKERKEI